MATYQERIGRYRIVYHDELPPQHKAEMRLCGIDPDTRRCLEWSFNDEDAAQEMFAECIAHAPSYKTYYLVDHGSEVVIERNADFF
jgi:hypothetical protein